MSSLLVAVVLLIQLVALLVVTVRLRQVSEGVSTLIAVSEREAEKVRQAVLASGASMQTAFRASRATVEVNPEALEGLANTLDAAQTRLVERVEENTKELARALVPAMKKIALARPDVSSLTTEVIKLQAIMQKHMRELSVWSAGERKELSSVGARFEEQAVKTAQMLERAGQHISELEMLGERHQEALRSATVTTLEELLNSLDGIRSELSTVGGRQDRILNHQHDSTQVLSRLSQSIDGYVELLRRADAA